MIERALASLMEPMRSAKQRAETEQEQLPPTIARMAARLSGSPGSGNAAYAEYQKLHSDAEQLNDLLREKGCASYRIDGEAAPSLQP
jgi:hypothetical protein